MLEKHHVCGIVSEVGFSQLATMRGMIRRKYSKGNYCCVFMYLHAYEYKYIKCPHVYAECLRADNSADIYSWRMCMRMCMCMYESGAYLCACVCVYVYACVGVCMCVYTRVRIAYVFMYVYVYM